MPAAATKVSAKKQRQQSLFIVHLPSQFPDDERIWQPSRALDLKATLPSCTCLLHRYLPGPTGGWSGAAWSGSKGA